VGWREVGIQKEKGLGGAKVHKVGVLLVELE
jgi:hypothetical protein